MIQHCWSHRHTELLALDYRLVNVIDITSWPETSVREVGLVFGSFCRISKVGRCDGRWTWSCLMSSRQYYDYTVSRGSDYVI